ncbi:hypothetical protein B0H16DRAFT_1880878 [Mycena metata]|uniref:Fungal-type protein kinase domain-containing protein n=1 Tax=Mycena metata TaxID=1033252 RepID=A0AAD7NSC0_9AGAR|nr:hypothetical protein B0H16DRAFT_1880878 [Mycena metata]
MPVKLDAAATHEERRSVELASRGTAATVSSTPRSSASPELIRERESAQASASETDSTPVKSGSAVEEEIRSRRSKSTDLVESVVGSLVDIDGAADILRELMGMSILSAQKQAQGRWHNVRKSAYKAACADAAVQAHEAVTPSKPSPADSYRWSWGLPVEASETAGALFLNVVAIAAHAAALRSGKAQEYPLPSLRFITLPDPQRAVPLSNETAAQDCRPDVVALDCSAFCEAPNPNAPVNQFFLLRDSPFQFIRAKLPAILSFTPKHKSAVGTAILAFQQWFDAQEKRNYLDMTRFCWPELELSAEAKLSDIHDAVLQELVYMRQQRRTQPWMKFIVGLVLTTRIMGILRADTLGIEQCTFSRDCSRGVLDTVRICLGLVRTSCHQRGQHEAFELHNTETFAPPHLELKSTPSTKTRPSKTTVDFDLDNLFAVPDPAFKYIHRTVRFIKLRGDKIHYSPDDTKPNITFYVHYVVQDRGSLVGRCPRIFCVSRETESKGSIRQFVGPYALKVYYADHASDCYKDDLIDIARKAQVKNVLLPTWEWRYGDALSMRGFPPDVAVRPVPSVANNREEIFAQSDLKRVLVQCSDHLEFGKAFLDFIAGIASLAEQDLVHRDLSIGNVLLSQDTPCPQAFLADAAVSAEALLGTPVAFTQRALEQRMGGLIHDMDMAGRVHHPPKKARTEAFSDADFFKMLISAPAKPVRPVGIRTGTPPFMAIGLLVLGPPHLVAYDLHSLLFVMALFFWSHSTFSKVPFPQFVTSKDRPWPSDVLRWANRPVNFSLAELGNLKRGFFADPEKLAAVIRRTLEGDLWTEEPVYLEYFWTLYGALWEWSDSMSEWRDNRTVTPSQVEQAFSSKYLEYNTPSPDGDDTFETLL